MRNLLLRPNVMQAMEKSSPQLKKYEVLKKNNFKYNGSIIKISFYI